MLDHEQFNQALSNIRDSVLDCDAVYLEMLGGEPTISRAVRSAITHPIDPKFKFVLTSNGSADIEWWTNAAPNLDTVILAWHSTCDTEHFKQVAALLSTYEHLRLHITINALPNSTEWETATALYEQFKADNYKSEFKIMFANHNKGNDQFLEYKPVQMVFYAKENGYSVPSDPAKYNLPDFISQLYTDYKSHLCWAGVDQVVINYFGYVYRGWCMVGNGYGNVFDAPVTLDSSPKICNRTLCKNGFDQQAKKSEKSWGLV